MQNIPHSQIPGSPPPHTAPAHIWDYWAIVMKRIIHVILFVLVSVGAAYLITQKQQKQYKAGAVIQLLPPSILGGGGGTFVPVIMSDDVYLSTQLSILTTPSTINKAVKEANLSSLPDFQGKSDAEIARMAYGRVDCVRRRGVYLVDVSVTGTEPKVLDDIANALVKTFQGMQRSTSKQLREERKAFLADKISTAEAQIHLLSLDKKGALQGANFTEATFESEWTKIQASRERYVERSDTVYQELLADEPVFETFKQAMQDPAKGADSLAQHPYMMLNPRLRQADDVILALRDLKAKKLRDGLLANNPEIRLLDDQVEDATRNRKRVIEDEVSRFLLQYQGKASQHEGLRKQAELRTQEMTAAAAVKHGVDQKNEEIHRHEENQRIASHELEALTQSANDAKEAVLIQEPASEPNSPYSPNATTNLTLGLVFGLVGALGLAFLLDYLDDTIRTKDELAKVAPDVPLLGIVPNIEARKSEVAKKDLFAANQPKSTISEAYRGVRTALTLSTRGPQQKAMLLTSAGPREGKTTTAINLATVLAFSGARTLIIDADLRKPRIHASFNLPNKKGLTNLIVGEDDPAEYCQHTAVDRVDVLTSGPIPPNPSELLGRPRMREILRKLRERYDQIIIDTPPIGAVTDAAVIATMVDGVILVVHAGKTRRQIVSRGIEQLRYISAPIIGVILNNLRIGRGRYYPGYYHYYYYYASHYGAEDGESKKTKAIKAAAPPEAPPGGGPSAS